MLQNPGAETNPITLDDELAEARLKAMLEEARNRAIIQEAEFTNQPMDLCFAVVKTCIPGDLSTKKRELTKAIQRYFQEKLFIKISHEHFYPRPQPDYSLPQTEPKLTELVLYGVDFLTTNAIKDRLQATEAEIQEITWVNDSTCRVVCRSKEEADRILKTQVREIKLEDEAESLKGWFLLKPYTLYSFERTLWARYATITETLSKQETSKYLIYFEAKRGLAPFLLQQFDAEEKYKAVVEQLQAKRAPRRRPRWPSREAVHSRSRDKNKNPMRHQRQFVRGENRRDQRTNRFMRRGRLQLQENRMIKYAHQPVENEDDSYHFTPLSNRNNKEDHSYDFAYNPLQKKNINDDYEFVGAPQGPPPSMDISICINSNQVQAVYDNISDRDSEFSYNGFTSFLSKQKEPQEDNRMDYRYDPTVKRKPPQDCSILFGPRILMKNEQSDSSFKANQTPNHEEESEDFFDFRQNKPQRQQSTLNSSFCYEKQTTQQKKNMNTSYDDDSY